jgi:TetR/AcrR family transcriptional regulator, transcriptional repressor for nem operon
MARTREFDTEATLRTALDLFWKKGYHAASVDDLVQTTGVNRASLYGTFGDKHNLYESSLKLYIEDAFREVRTELQQHASGLKAIEALLQRVVRDSVGDVERRGCFAANSTAELCPSDEKILALCNLGRMSMERELERAVERGQAAGEITTRRSARELSRFLGSVIMTLRSSSRMQLSRAHLQGVADIALDALRK